MHDLCSILLYFPICPLFSQPLNLSLSCLSTFVWSFYILKLSIIYFRKGCSVWLLNALQLRFVCQVSLVQMKNSCRYQGSEKGSQQFCRYPLKGAVKSLYIHANVFYIYEYPLKSPYRSWYTTKGSTQRQHGKVYYSLRKINLQCKPREPEQINLCSILPLN